MTEKTARDWRDALWTAHRSLFEGTAPFATGIGTLPLGWRELVETLCMRLTAAATGASGRVLVSRLEEDRAVLQVGWETASPGTGFEVEAADAVARASARSACTCSVCGRAGKRYRVGIGVFAACPLHRPLGSIEVSPNWPTIRTTRGFVEGGSRIVVCEAYHRGYDRFVAASPEALGIKDWP